MTYNKNWFEEHEKELESLYMNRYVTVYNGRVINSGMNLNDLIREFVLEYGEVEVYFGYVGEQPATEIGTNTTTDEPSIGETEKYRGVTPAGE